MWKDIHNLSTQLLQPSAVFPKTNTRKMTDKAIFLKTHVYTAGRPDWTETQ